MNTIENIDSVPGTKQAPIYEFIIPTSHTMRQAQIRSSLTVRETEAQNWAKLRGVDQKAFLGHDSCGCDRRFCQKGDCWEGKGEVPRLRTWGPLNLGTRAFPTTQETLWVSSKLKSRTVREMPESHAPMEGEGQRTCWKRVNFACVAECCLIFLSFITRTQLLEPFIFTTQSVNQC